MNFSDKELKIGNFLGIPLFLSFGFLVFLIALFTFCVGSYFLYNNTAYLFIIVSFFIIYASILSHEYAHAFVAKYYFKKPIEKIVIYVMGGGVLILYNLKKPKEEFFIAIIGPILNLTLSLFLYLLLYLDFFQYFKSVINEAIYINIIIGLFNLIPIFPLDGAKILRSIINYFTNNLYLSTFMSARISQLLSFSVLLCVLIFMAIFNVSIIFYYFLILIFALIFAIIQSEEQLVYIKYLYDLNDWFKEVLTLSEEDQKILFQKESIEELEFNLACIQELKIFIGEDYHELSNYLLEIINLKNKQLLN